MSKFKFVSNRNRATNNCRADRRRPQNEIEAKRNRGTGETQWTKNKRSKFELVFGKVEKTFSVPFHSSPRPFGLPIVTYVPVIDCEKKRNDTQHTSQFKKQSGQHPCRGSFPMVFVRSNTDALFRTKNRQERTLEATTRTHREHKSSPASSCREGEIPTTSWYDAKPSSA